MSLAEQGAYLRLMCYAWLDEGIPDDPLLIAKLLQIPIRTWRKMESRMRVVFVQNGEGRLINPRQERVRDEQRKHNERMTLAARKGASARWGKEHSEDGKANATAYRSHTDGKQTAMRIDASASATAVRTEPPLTPPQAEGNGKKSAKRRQRHQIVAGLDPGGQCQICGEHRPKPNGFCRGGGVHPGGAP